MEISKESPVNLDDINPLKISNVRERREYYKEKTRLMHWDNFKEEAELQIDIILLTQNKDTNQVSDIHLET